ncbi:MAG: class I tRNA ligase family protein, partial [Micrococcales bacterium]|nr:class I tRNA ligase family protein [Micrococcales bacterium]
TTPWTLPSNMGIAVHPDVSYVVVESDASGKTERFLIAEPRLSSYAKDLFGDAKADVGERIVERLTGAELVGRTYTPPFSYYADKPHAHRVLAADFVTTEDGTGIVHMSPGFGEDDKAVLDAAGVETVVPVGADGRFIFPVVDYEGMHVFDANAVIIDHLKGRTYVDGAGGQAEVGSSTPGTVLLRRETYDHSYPHCWRCRQPLIYMAVSSWFVEVTKLKDRMVELNQEIDWVPEHVKYGQFGKWLENARDWSISRNRFWGSPIPVWQSDDPRYPRIDVYGSFEQLEADFGTIPKNAAGEPDLHRPFIDHLTRPNPGDPTGQSVMRRVEDVLDVWFDSGSMSFAQVHYPFENAEWFEHHFPGDFIVEYIGQTRGWFYTLHILATALFDRPAFRACLSHGIVLGNDGQKMSKSRRNYPDVREVFDRDGADAMRWFLMSSPILRGGNLVVTEQGIREGVRQALLPLWSTWYFFTLYANAADQGPMSDGYDAKWSTGSADVLDRYLLAKLRELVEEVTTDLDAYDVAAACDQIRAFFDVLTNWYVRRSRDRFWDTGDLANESVSDAFDTLYTTLEVLCRVAAPLLPLTTEEVWRGLTGGRSVHLTDWPVAEDLPADRDLVRRMDRAREICSIGSSLRKANNLRVRLPLARLTVVTEQSDGLLDFTGIIADELNLRQVALVELCGASEAEFGVSQKLSVNARAAGPRLGKQVQIAIKGSKSGDWSVGPDGSVTSGGLALLDGEFTLEAVVSDSGSHGHATAMLPGGGFVVLETAVTPELAQEGLARDVIRAVQQARKEAGFDVSDRIGLTILGDEEVWRACLAHERLITAETLAIQFGAAADIGALPEHLGMSSTVGDGRPIRVLVSKK